MHRSVNADDSIFLSILNPNVSEYILNFIFGVHCAVCACHQLPLIRLYLSCSCMRIVCCLLSLLSNASHFCLLFFLLISFCCSRGILGEKYAYESSLIVRYCYTIRWLTVWWLIHYCRNRTPCIFRSFCTKSKLCWMAGCMDGGYYRSLTHDANGNVLWSQRKVNVYDYTVDE